MAEKANGTKYITPKNIALTKTYDKNTCDTNARIERNPISGMGAIR